MKMIIRADDVGYSRTHNDGSFEAIDHGVSTAADVMLDCPGTEDALLRLRERPWISVGWHTHFWGSPVLDPADVPTLVENDGGRIRFRKDLHTAEDISYDEIVAECRAQIERCIRILGRTPDTGAGGRDDSLFTRALTRTSAEYGMPVLSYGKMMDKDSGFPIKFPREFLASNAQLFTDSLEEIEKYDPLSCFLNLDFTKYGEDDCLFTALHPGYVDYFVYRLGDYGPNARKYILCRMEDVHAICSETLHNWVRDNHIELTHQRDVLHGTRSYQNHLKVTGSDLYIGEA